MGEGASTEPATPWEAPATPFPQMKAGCAGTQPPVASGDAPRGPRVSEAWLLCPPFFPSTRQSVKARVLSRGTGTWLDAWGSLTGLRPSLPELAAGRLRRGQTTRTPQRG